MKMKDLIKPSAPPMEPGAYLGVCFGVVGLGEQETTYKGKTRYVEKIKFLFECPEETILQDGEERPRQLSVDFSVAKKATSRIRQFYSGWLGKTLSDEEYMELDTDIFLGRNAILNVVRSEDGQYANIASAMPLRRSEQPVKAVSQQINFDATQWDQAAFETLPEYLQERLKQSTQYKNAHLPEQEVSVEQAAQEAAEDAGAEYPAGEGACPF